MSGGKISPSLYNTLKWIKTFIKPGTLGSTHSLKFTVSEFKFEWLFNARTMSECRVV